MNRRSFIRNAGWVSTGLIFVPRPMRAQTILTAPGLASFKKKTSGGGGGGGGTYSLITHSFGKGGTPTTTAANTTGANLIVVSVSWFSSAQTLSDSKGNTWTALTQFSSGGVYLTQLFYCINPTVGSGHTFTSTGNLAVLSVSAFALSSGTPAYDSPNQNGSSVAVNVSSFQTGSVTPSGNNELIVSGVTFNDVGADTTTSVDSSFTITDQNESGTRSQFYGAMAYKIQTTGSSENPTWSFSATINTASAGIAVFK